MCHVVPPGRFEFEVALHQLSGLGTESHPFQIRQMLGDLGVLDRLGGGLSGAEPKRDLAGSQRDEAVAVGAEKLDDRWQGRDGRWVAWAGVVHQYDRVGQGAALLSQPDDALHPVRRP